MLAVAELQMSDTKTLLPAISPPLQQSSKEQHQGWNPPFLKRTPPSHFLPHLEPTLVDICKWLIPSPTIFEKPLYGQNMKWLSASV